MEVLPNDYVLTEIDTGDLTFEEVSAIGANIADTMAAGDAWLLANQSPLLKVPPVIIPENFNVLINPNHPASDKVAIKSKPPFSFDPRLWKPEA